MRNLVSTILIAMSVSALSGLFGGWLFHTHYATQPQTAVVDVTRIMTYYNARLTELALDGNIQSTEIKTFVKEIDVATRDVANELAKRHKQPVFLSDAVLSPSLDLTEEAQILLAYRFPKLKSSAAPTTPSTSSRTDSIDKLKPEPTATDQAP